MRKLLINILFAVSLCFSFLLAGQAGAQNTWYVAPPPAGDDGNAGDSWGAPFATISNALTAAGAGGAGHAVFVSNGTYDLTAEIVFTQHLSLRSWNNGVVDPTNTVFNGNNANRCMYINGNQTLTVVDGFTFSNGYASADDRQGRGGGVYQLTCTVTNCIFTDNIAVSNGGGIFVGSTLSRLLHSVLRNNAALATDVNSQGGGGAYALNNGLIDSCRFVSNSAWDGGGMLTREGMLTAANCEFIGNEAARYGGGAYAYYAGTFTDCRFENNNASAGGGAALYFARGIFSNCVAAGNSAKNGAGVYLVRARSGNYSVPVVDCLISNNTADYYGGGVYYSAANIGETNRLHNCRIVENQAANGGGVFYSGGTSNAWITGCDISGNIAVTNGGGIYAQRWGVIENCTIAGNDAGDEGGGIYFANSDAITNLMINCIIYRNTAGDTSSNWWYTAAGGDVFSVSNTCAAPSLSDYGAGNIEDNPLFIDPGAGNHRLQSRSPGINAGLLRDWMTGAIDLDGNPRIRNHFVDMGAYEGLLGGTIFSVR